MKLIKPKFWKTNNLTSYLLWPLTLITRLIIILKKNRHSYKSNISTLCVGNIYLGGTGKTQLVIELNKMLESKFKICVIKKKYESQIDEQKLLAKSTTLILPSRRIEGLKKVEKSKKNLVIFDDGLQDKSIKYRLSLVCFNSLTGIGNGKILPAGPLRESLAELKNYNAVFINGGKNKILNEKIKKYNKDIKIFYGKYNLKNKKDFNIKLKYLAFCGIGTPENFFNLLKKNKLKIIKKITFPDHYDYKISDLNKIKKIAKKNNLQIVTTEKDFTKINKFKNNQIKFTKVNLLINNRTSFKKFLGNNL